MIWIYPSEKADFQMRIFNADGSEAMMCGNGIRCVGKYVYDKGYTDKTRLTVDTLSGVRTLSLHLKEGKVDRVTVDMGIAKLGEELALMVDGAETVCLPVNVGNPHAVVFVKDAAAAPILTLGPKLERHPAFSGGVNVEFVQRLGKDRLRMRVWERGSGVTLACGTGACASVTAAVAKGFCPAGSPVFVELDGGILEVAVDKSNAVTMTGPADIVYEGEVEGC